METDSNERCVLIAGLVGEQARDRVWGDPAYMQSLDRLRKRGLVDFIEKRGANGRIMVSAARGLLRSGIRVARQLQEDEKAESSSLGHIVLVG